MAGPLYTATQQAANPLLRATNSRVKTQQLSPEEETTLLPMIGRKVLSGAAAVGNVLDLPGSSVRDVLTGNNPFDQWLSPFSGEDRTSGRDLLTHWGIANQNKETGFTPFSDPMEAVRDTAGLGAEIFFDPFAWVSPLGFARAGQVAERAGLTRKLGNIGGVGKAEGRLKLTPRDLLETAAERESFAVAAKAKGFNPDDLLDEKLGGVLGVGLPFKQPAFVLGKEGGLGERIAKGLDKAGAATARLAPIRYARALFDRSVMGATNSVEAQRIGKAAFDSREAAIATARGELAPIVQRLDAAGVFDPGRTAASGVTTTRGAAGTSALNNSLKTMQYLEEVGDNWHQLPAHLQPFRQDLDTMKRLTAQIGDMEEGIGLASPMLDDVVNYFPRSKYFFPKESRKLKPGGFVVDTTNPHFQGRRQFLKNHPGGTTALQLMSIDPTISGYFWRKNRFPVSNVDQLALGADDLAFIRQHIDNAYGGHLKGLEPGEVDQLARWVSMLDPRHADMQVTAFELNPVKALLSRLEHGHRSIGAADASLNLLVHAATDNPNIPGELVNLADALDATKINGERAHEVLANRLGDLYTNKHAELQATASGINPQGLIVPGTPAPVPVDVTSADVLRNLFVPAEVVGDATRFMRNFTQPDEVNGFVKGMDGFINLWKTGMTALFPAFHMRNLMTGQYQNMIGGAFDPFATGPLKYLQPMRDADRLLRHGGEISNVLQIPIVQARGITDPAEATKFIQQLLFQHGVAGGNKGQIGETLGRGMDNLASQMPGLRPTSLTEVAKSGIPRNVSEANPLNLKGVLANEDVFAPAKAGREFGNYIEGMNRTAPFIAFLKQGMDPAEAARRVNLLQGNYANLSKFEAAAMRRIFPFYNFTRQMVPMVVETLWKHPGGALAQTIRATEAGRGESATTPDYVQQTASIPVGTLEDGTQRYLTGASGMHEQVVDLLGLAATNPLSAGTELLSSTNPILKTIIEGATGESLFQRGPRGGRNLEDQDPLIGRLLANVTGQEDAVKTNQTLELLAGNSPLSRTLSTLRTLTDPRKRNTLAPQLPIPGLAGLSNLTTGFRFADISPGAQDTKLRESADALMRDLGAKTFEDVYFPQERLATMPPEQQGKALILKRLRRTLEARTKERKQAKAKAKESASKN